MGIRPALVNRMKSDTATEIGEGRIEHDERELEQIGTRVHLGGGPPHPRPEQGNETDYGGHDPDCLRAAQEHVQREQKEIANQLIGN